MTTHRSSKQLVPAADEALPWRAWQDALADGTIDASIADLYDRLDEQVRRRGPTCWMSGRCCQFETFGHRLYVTGLEITWVLKRAVIPTSGLEHRTHTPRRAQPARAAQGDANHASPTDCPFQAGKLCSIHAVRPLGCRIFFCQDGTQQWQHDLYEQFLAELRALHDERGLSYHYMEWRSGVHEALRELKAGHGHP